MATARDHAVIPSLMYPLALHAVQRRGSSSSTPQRVACMGSEPVPAVCMGFPGHLPPFTPTVSPGSSTGPGPCPWTTSPSAEDAFRPCLRQPSLGFHDHPCLVTCGPLSVPLVLLEACPDLSRLHVCSAGQAVPRAPLTLCPSTPRPTGSGSIYPVPSCIKHGLSKVLSDHSGALPPAHSLPRGGCTAHRAAPACSLGANAGRSPP